MSKEFFRYEPHGHSSISDGFDNPRRVARAAIGKVDALGLADHNTPEGLHEFLEEVRKINEAGIPLIPVPSIEVSTSQGHVIIATPDLSLTDAFTTWASKTQLKNTEPKALIEHATQEFGSVCIFTHPEIPYSGGFSLQGIEQLIDLLPQDLIGHLAIEVDNNSASIISFIIGKRVREWNRQFCLAEVAGSDYHTKYLVGRLWTSVPKYSYSGLDILHAVKTRETVPDGRRITLRDIILTLVSHSSAFERHRSGHNFYAAAHKILEIIGNR